jgi:SAM-dependent methyltransferase
MNKIVSEESYKSLWNKVEDSGNRLRDEWYYRAKAKEHVQLFSEEDKQRDCIDLGCGAGEILQYMTSEIKVNTALDFSEKMIQLAEKLNYHRRPKFICADCFEYLPSCTAEVWTTCGAINQYLNYQRISDIIRIFAESQQACSFYLFDCIDPILYAALNLGSKFKKERIDNKLSLSGFASAIKEFIIVSYNINFISPTYKYSFLHFGFGHAPVLWHSLSTKYNLQFEILSSRYFEYRYHVILKK